MKPQRELLTISHTLGLAAISALLLFFISVAHAINIQQKSEHQTSSIISHWDKVVLAYDKRFSWGVNKQPSVPAGCHVTPNFNHQRRRSIISTLLCKERIVLLRPKSQVNSFKLQQKKQGYIDFSMPNMGIIHAKAHIVSVLHLPVAEATLTNFGSQPVTGIFIFHTQNVKTYTFKNYRTGLFSKIHVTPNHPFYAANLHSYVPISSLSSTDKLVSLSKNRVALVCQRNKMHDCGVPYKKKRIVTVYNLEVYMQHRYFVGTSKILVHNGCNSCAICGKEFDSVQSVRGHMNRMHSGETPFKCQVIESYDPLTICDRTFCTEDDLISHRFNHFFFVKKHKCEWPGCDLVFERYDKMRVHYRIHTNDRQYKCEYEGCEKSFTSFPGKNRHYKRVHEKTILTCPHEGCGRTFGYRSNLKAHILKKHK